MSASPFVVGTAGHVDHGKSTLVKALTGIDPDRLAEEKAREMTIDLGFAWLDLPTGSRVSVVDVPGHERFIKNMLAGIGGIDAALLVIAADEGPMPQTGEHLAIIDLLGIRHGVVAMTKADTVDDEWMDVVEEEIRERLAGTSLENAPVVRVSAYTGMGLPALIDALEGQLVQVERDRRRLQPRLPVDRVFTVQGFGTVVTGTLIDGLLKVGQEVVVMPAGLSARVRGLQTHKAKEETAEPGARTAVNLSQIAVEEIRRGDVVTVPNHLRASLRLDGALRLLADAGLTLEQNDEVDLFVGAAETPAWVTLLDRERLEPGETGWVQFRLRDPLAVLRGDRFIVRRPSPSQTIGGGSVVDASPSRHKRFRPEVLEVLETLAQGSPEELVLQACADRPVAIADLLTGPLAGLPPEDSRRSIAGLVQAGDLRLLGSPSQANAPGNLVISREAWHRLLAEMTSDLQAFHRSQPLRKGMAREELRQRSRLAARSFDQVLQTASAEGVLADDGPTVRLASFTVTLDPARRSAADRFLAALAAAPFSPPAPAEFGLDSSTLSVLADSGEIVRLSDSIAFSPEAFRAMENGVLEILDRDGTLTLAGFRDRFQTSRKYAQAVLETMDQRRITRRVGDERVRFGGSRESKPAVL